MTSPRRITYAERNAGTTGPPPGRQTDRWPPGAAESALCAAFKCAFNPRPAAPFSEKVPAPSKHCVSAGCWGQTGVF